MWKSAVKTITFSKFLKMFRCSHEWGEWSRTLVTVFTIPSCPFPGWVRTCVKCGKTECKI